MDVAAAEARVLCVVLVAVMSPPVILRVVVPGLGRWAADVTVFTEPSDSFT